MSTMFPLPRARVPQSPEHSCGMQEGSPTTAFPLYVEVYGTCTKNLFSTLKLLQRIREVSLGRANYQEFFIVHDRYE